MAVITKNDRMQPLLHNTAYAWKQPRRETMPRSIDRVLSNYSHWLVALIFFVRRREGFLSSLECL